MEVHHHPQVEKKNIKEYLLEGLMIFLAVILGFIAENIREHFVDKEKETQNIKSILKSIAGDTVNLRSIASTNLLTLEHLDKLISFKDSNLNNNSTIIELYTHIINGTFNDVYFRSNDAAFQQLQSSGSLRLIHKEIVVDSLFQYQYKNSLFQRQEPDCYHFTKVVWDDISRLVDLTFIRDTSKLKINFDVIAGTFNVPKGKEMLLSNDKKLLDKFFNDISVLTLATDIYMGLLNRQLLYGRNLIAFLKKEYHLEND